MLGLSMLTVAMNNDNPRGCTEATVFGPFYVQNAPHYDLGSDVANGARGGPAWCAGCAGTMASPSPPEIHVWQSDEEGLYDVQHEGLDQHRREGILRATRRAASISAQSWPSAYPFPTTARSVRYSRGPGGIRGGPRICTS